MSPRILDLRRRRRRPALSGYDGPPAELGILRGKLARVLHDRSAERAAYVFGDTIAARRPRGGRARGVRRGAGERRR